MKSGSAQVCFCFWQETIAKSLSHTHACGSHYVNINLFLKIIFAILRSSTSTEMLMATMMVDVVGWIKQLFVEPAVRICKET